MYKCPECQKDMIWQNDFDSEDVGREEPGIVSFWSCDDCHIELEKFMPIG